MFATTRWTLVAAATDPADPHAREALADLCRAYWFPVYAYVRRRGHDHHAAQDAMREKKLEPGAALAVVRQLCDALEYAHAQGVVHRDVKPENVLLTRDGRVKIADFGLAKVADREAVSLTGTRQAMGTPHYMAPEQWEQPAAVDHRADIYALGVVLYELLTGELPLGRFDPPSQKVRLDVRLDEVVLRALAKEPDRRYQRASQVRTDLDRIQGDGDG